MINNPFFSIWIHPRKTIAPILENHPTRHVLLLAAIFGSVGGVVEVLKLQYAELGLELGILTLLAAIVVGAALVILGLYLMGWVYSMVGGWFDGESDALHMRCAIIWASIPRFVANLLLLILVLLTSRVVLSPELWQPGAMSLGTIILAAFAYLLAFTFAIWGVVLLCHTIGEAHGFSAWKGLLTLLLSGLVIAFAAILLMIPIIIVIAGIA